jgi:hypothetical protein
MKKTVATLLVRNFYGKVGSVSSEKEAEKTSLLRTYDTR